MPMKDKDDMMPIKCKGNIMPIKYKGTDTLSTESDRVYKNKWHLSSTNFEGKKPRFVRFAFSRRNVPKLPSRVHRSATG